MIDWVIIVLALISLALGYGLVKVNPLVGGIAGIITILLVLGLMLSAVLGSAGFLAFFMSGWAMYLTVFATSYTIGSVIGLFA